MEPGSDLSPPGSSLLLCSDNLGAEGHSRWEIAPIAQQRAQSQCSEEDAEKTRQNQGNFQNNCASVYQGFLLFCSESKAQNEGLQQWKQTFRVSSFRGVS